MRRCEICYREKKTKQMHLEFKSIDCLELRGQEIHTFRLFSVDACHTLLWLCHMILFRSDSSCKMICTIFDAKFDRIFVLTIIVPVFQ